MFKFGLGQNVVIAVSKEAGVVIGRAEYQQYTNPQYLVRYADGTGTARESWWAEDALEEDSLV